MCQPSILIPLPTSARNHQAINSAYLERLGCAWNVIQDQNCVHNLANKLSSILKDPKILDVMSKQLFALQSRESNDIVQEISKAIAI